MVYQPLERKVVIAKATEQKKVQTGVCSGHWFVQGN